MFDAEIDRLESALRSCPDPRWEAGLWEVRRTDPWMWPRPGQDDGTRTVEQIQVFSAFWLVAYHCLHHLDFYLWDGSGEWVAPARFAGGPEDDPIGADGAAVLPAVVYSREDLLGYAAYCRERAREVLSNVTREQLARRCGPGHPHRGKNFEQLLRINLAHLREHAAQLEKGAAG